MIVGIVALPFSIAFAIASGVAPEKGLITAIVAGFFISAFRGSRVQIGGATGGVIVIMYGIVQEHGVEGLTIATLMAGLLLVVLGLVRAEALLRYFPHTLIVGFTTGIAVIIFSTRINGLQGRFFSRFPITTNGGQCISCGNCSTYCEMGIDVRSYAQRGENIVRASCVGCGLCASVCPRGVLKLENGKPQARLNNAPLSITATGVKLEV